MNGICNLLYGTDSAGDIGNMRTCHDSGLAGKQGLQLRWIANWILWVASSPPLYGQAQSVCDLDPRSGVGLVVELG